MNTIIRISEVLFQKYGFYVPLAEIGYETQWLYKDEVDEHLVPAHLMEQLEETVIFNAASYEAKNGTYYLLLQLFLPNDEIHEIWLVNDEIVPNFLDDLK